MFERMFESVCVGGLPNGKEIEAPHASGGVQIARQLELALVSASASICRKQRVADICRAQRDLDLH
jgi:hypothetical protein